MLAYFHMLIIGMNFVCLFFFGMNFVSGIVKDGREI